MADEVSLKEHFNQRFIDSEKALNIALQASQRASDLALESQKTVNATQNEFRGALKDQTSTLMPRAEFENAIARINDDVRVLRESRAELAGKASQSSLNITTVISMIGLLLALMSIIVRFIK